MLFLPQRPYMLLGSLRSQLLYPLREQEIADEDLLRLLEKVNLPDLAARFDVPLNTMRTWRTQFRPSGPVTVEYPFVFAPVN